MAHRHITESDIAEQPSLVMDLQIRHFGNTGVTPDAIMRQHGNVASPALFAGLVEEKNAPYRLTDDTSANVLMRAHTALWFLNKAEYQQFKTGKRTADLQPWQPGDGDAYAFVAFAVSQVPNGLARLLADLIDRLPSHAAYPHLKEIFWFTRSDKGAMITSYVAAEQLPDNYVLKNTDGTTYCPFYRLPCAGGLPDMQTVINKLLGIENNFARDVLANSKNA